MSSTVVEQLPAFNPAEGSVSRSDETIQRLLLAAGEIFGEFGYANATIRQICGQADANIAAVNYHFGGKRQLYLSAMKWGMEQAYAKHSVHGDADANAPVEVRLHAYCRNFIRRLLDPELPQWCGVLLAREMCEPSEGAAELIEQICVPKFAALTALLQELIGPGATEDELRLHMRSVVAQIMFYRYANRLLVQLDPDERLGLPDIDRIAEHVSRVTLAATRG